METFNIRVADTVFSITAEYDSTKRYCREYLIESEDTPESTNETKENENELIIRRDDIEYERGELQCYLEAHPEEQVSEVTDAYLELLALHRMISEVLLDRGTLLFHGSAVAVDSKTYLFTAPSGTGKSTHAALWRQKFGDRAMMVNDDKPFLHIAEDAVYAYGSPWNGKHHLGANVVVPLEAICILERASENSIEEIGFQEAYPQIFQQTYRPKERKKLLRMMELLDQFQGKVRFYRLRCNMDPEAADVSYEGMQK